MKATKDEMIMEAVKRMKMFKIFPETIRQFKKDGYISISEPPYGAFYWVKEEENDEIKDFEKKHDAVVYMVVRSFTEFGKVDSYLFVGCDRSDWEYDRNDIEEGQALVWAKNCDYPECSEFGIIGLKRSVAAGLLRSW